MKFAVSDAVKAGTLTCGSDADKDVLGAGRMLSLGDGISTFGHCSSNQSGPASAPTIGRKWHSRSAY